MKRTVHVVGNGDHAGYFWNEPRHGMRLCCNVPPFAVPNSYATIMVDFKMMKAIHEGSVTIGGEWIIGMRPKIYMEKNPSFHIKHSKNSFILAETLAPCSVKLYEGSQILSLVSCTVVPEPLACDFNNISLYLDRL